MVVVVVVVLVCVCVCVFVCAGCCVGCALAGVIGEQHARTWRTKVSIKPLLVQMHPVRQSVLVVFAAKAPRSAYSIHTLCHQCRRLVASR